jgi:hypothetical protein
MMYKHLSWILLCGLLCWSQVVGQTPYSIVKQVLTPLLERVMLGPDDLIVTIISDKGVENIDIGVPMHTNHIYLLIKSGGITYARIGATGILYELSVSSRGDSVIFQRIDQTTHFGYNINAFEFSHKGRLYNLGGYGYWRWNGQLREFNGKMKEWHIIPLDRELPLSAGTPGSFPWIDAQSGRVYIMRYMLGNEAVKNDPNRWADSVFSLDLRTNQWKVIGMTPSFKVSGELQRVMATHDSGLLVYTGNNIELWNYQRNQIRTLVDDSMRAELLTLRGNRYVWFERNKLLIGDAISGGLDSLQLEHDDFIDMGKPVYLPMQERSAKEYLLFGGVIIMGGLFWMFRGRLKIKGPDTSRVRKETEIQMMQQEAPMRISENPVNEKVAPRSPGEPHPFDAVESSLLSLLYENNDTHQKRSTTQEVNRILGVGNKTLDMQKRKRSDVIRAINRKFHLLHPERSAELILKDRSDFDGRLSEYYINPAELTFIRMYLP